MSAELVSKNKKLGENEYPTWLLLDCKTCGANLAIYQKVGDSELNQLYHDRIIAPKGLSPDNGLMCGGCKTHLTEPTTYVENGRTIYTLLPDMIKETTITEEKIVEVLGSNTSTDSTEQS